MINIHDQYPKIKIEGKMYDRIPFKSDLIKNDQDEGFDTCPDYGVKPGEIHWWSCDWEVCPKCGGQLLSCNCEIEDFTIQPIHFIRKAVS